MNKDVQFKEGIDDHKQFRARESMNPSAPPGHMFIKRHRNKSKRIEKTVDIELNSLRSQLKLTEL